MRCEEIDELAGALALGAALPEEVDAARTHAATCERCRATLQRFIATAGLLAEAVEPVAPPARLRERILAAARADLAAETDIASGSDTPAPGAPSSAGAMTAFPAGQERLLPSSSAPAAGAGADALAGPPRSLRPAGARPAAPALRLLPARRRWTQPAWLAAAAVFVLAVGLGAWNVKLQRDLTRRDDRIEAQARALESVARGGQLVAFDPSPALAGARGSVLRPAQGQPVMSLDGLARPEGGRVYQLWAIRNGTPMDLGTFLPDEDGRAAMTLPDLTGAEALAVTVEPRRVAAPTGPQVLVAQLA